MKKNRVLFINGTVTINPSGTPDTTTLTDASAVVLAVEREKLFFAGAHPTNIESHVVKYKGKITLKKVPLRKETVEKIMGMTAATGVLSDGVTVSVNSKITEAAGYQSPEVEILIKGTDDATGGKIEIYAAKCVLTNDLEFNASSSEFCEQDIELECLGSDSSTTATTFEIREETVSAVSEPIITSLYPVGGAAAGGTPITIIGANFETGAQVVIGGVACTSENVVNANTITCITGAHAAGAVNVVVTNTDTGTDTATNAYTYA